jgi:hypothetical protein
MSPAPCLLAPTIINALSAALAPGLPRMGAAAAGAAPDLRRRLRRGFDEEDWTLAVRALGDAAAIAVLAIPDLPEMTETKRECRLRFLRAARARRPLLAWSSVLIALSEIEARPLRSHSRLCIVEIDGEGLRSQLLTIRDDEDAAAPERREAGRRFSSDLGFVARERAAEEAIATSSDSRPFRSALHADLPGRLAMVAPPYRLHELLRLSNGDWQETEWPAAMPSASDLADLSLPDCDEVIVQSPADSVFNEAVAALLREHCSVPVRYAPPCAVAHGALIAARRKQSQFVLSNRLSVRTARPSKMTASTRCG